jgi:hypothetical protein
MSWWYWYAVCFVVLLLACELSAPEHSWQGKLLIALLGPITLLGIAVGVCIRVVKDVWKGN